MRILELLAIVFGPDAALRPGRGARRAAGGPVDEEAVLVEPRDEARQALEGDRQPDGGRPLDDLAGRPRTVEHARERQLEPAQGRLSARTGVGDRDDVLASAATGIGECQVRAEPRNRLIGGQDGHRTLDIYNVPQVPRAERPWARATLRGAGCPRACARLSYLAWVSSVTDTLE
jgi:hypothetical protein